MIRRALLTLAIWMVLTDLVPAESSKSLLRLIKKASSTRVYEAVNPAERKQAQGLFATTFRDGYSDGLATRWAALAMDLTEVTHGTEQLLWLRESRGAERGRGCFLIRRPESSQVALQCPHSFKDLSTRSIGLDWMLEGSFGAVAFNTVPREFTNTDGQTIAADMAKEGSTYFMAFTLAWAQAYTKGAIIQVHGFAKGNRRTTQGKLSHVILSSCVKEPTEIVLALAREMRTLVQGMVSVYPNDVRELGGTLNVQALGLRYLGYARFVHLEICQEERNRLKSDMAYRRAWLQCLETRLGGKQ